MPLYAFLCDTCGPFETRREVSELASPVGCPECARPVRRVYTPPGVKTSSAALRSALGREEKSAHEPAVVGTPVGRPLPRPAHGSHPPWAGH